MVFPPARLTNPKDLNSRLSELALFRFVSNFQAFLLIDFLFSALKNQLIFQYRNEGVSKPKELISIRPETLLTTF